MRRSGADDREQEERMMKPMSLALAGLAALVGAGVAPAQLPGGLLGGAGLPNIGATSAGNAAGLLSYCVKNKLLGAQDASGVLGKLTGGAGVAGSQDYAQGQSGLIRTGQGQGLSLDSLKGKMKTKLCDMVLQHGKSLAGL
jgi:hypothetical protein